MRVDIFVYAPIIQYPLNLQRTGVPLNGAGRIQINFELEPVKEIEVMSKLPKMIFPWLWFEISFELPNYLVNLMKYTLHL